MEQLIPITGYAKTYKELCNKVAQPGEYYNVLEEKPFITYHKLDSTEIGDVMQETDVCGWVKNKAELESSVKPTEGDVWLTGEIAPYTRWKAQYINYVMNWVEDGEEDKKIVKKYKNYDMLRRAHLEPEEGVFYAVGKEAPFKLYGVISEWEPVGSFISYIANSVNALDISFTKGSKNVGEVGYVKGMYYIYDGKHFVKIDIPEPIEQAYEHVFETRGEKYKIREGVKLGTLEFYQVKE